MNAKKEKDPGRDSRQKEQHVQSHESEKGHSIWEWQEARCGFRIGCMGLGVNELWLGIRTCSSSNHRLSLDLCMNLALKAMGSSRGVLAGWCQISFVLEKAHPVCCVEKEMGVGEMLETQSICSTSVRKDP